MTCGPARLRRITATASSTGALTDPGDLPGVDHVVFVDVGELVGLDGQAVLPELLGVPHSDVPARDRDPKPLAGPRRVTLQKGRTVDGGGHRLQVQPGVFVAAADHDQTAA